MKTATTTMIPNLSNGDILVVDDNIACQKILSHVLSKVGNKVTIATTAEEALALLDQFVPDIAILDFHLPGANGDEVCSEIKARFGDLPVIMITGSDDEHLKTQLISQGANRFIGKPLDPGEILIQVKAAMNMRRLQQQLEKEASIRKSVEAQIQEVNTVMCHHFNAYLPADQGNSATACQLLELIESEDEEELFTFY